jgi:hypothetical protein
MLYFGAAGIMWGLEYLHGARVSDPLPDFSEARSRLLEGNRDTLRRFTPTTGSLLMADAGILLLDWKLSRSEPVAAELARAISDAAEHPSLELMWGSPGTMMAALTMHAMGQSEQHLEEGGRYRHSLWTGDIGLAIYLLSCIDGAAEFPTMDEF